MNFFKKKESSATVKVFILDFKYFLSLTIVCLFVCFFKRKWRMTEVCVCKLDQVLSCIFLYFSSLTDCHLSFLFVSFSFPAEAAPQPPLPAADPGAGGGGGRCRWFRQLRGPSVLPLVGNHLHRCFSSPKSPAGGPESQEKVGTHYVPLKVWWTLLTPPPEESYCSYCSFLPLVFALQVDLMIWDCLVLMLLSWYLDYFAEYRVGVCFCCNMRV